MPQKKAKKIKQEKPKKAAKIAKVKAVAAPQKKLVKPAVDLSKKKGAKPAPKELAKVALKGKKPVEIKAGKKAAPAPAKALKAAAPLPQKVKKEAAAPAKAAAKAAVPAKAAEVKGKKPQEVVVVMPASKGAAILVKDKKGKKGKSAEAAAAAKARRCREPGCDHDIAMVGYCRLHYIKNWRRIKRKEAILASGQLNNYVEELVNKYPDKYLDVIRQDLATEKEWNKVVVDLELEGTDEDGATDEDTDSAPEGVRATSGGGGRGGEFDDDGDAF